ncbi:DUF4249 domain-containing protein [Catalinimonas niigatensis]|uniref:DUF4249 domain-containing protein n=1 Tax=Catalinimonas niigatensis TaxID=1397264 RepID=UPI00266579A4|nr:DUF4249 domain-containing protein [Catalinimonas niigatensis]WPP48438.1 DUF4249 domain-containing protein [Catalinimonas niigatensis]
MKQATLWIGCLMLLSTCVERLELDESLSGEPLLVVDGIITNANEPYVVKLAYTSSSLQTYEANPLSDAQVYITDQEENRTDLTEVDAGEYETDPNFFQGNSGKSYRLHIIAPNGRTYASLPETMPDVPSIDNIYFELDSRPYESSIGTILDEWGLQFYLNTGSGENKNAYYRWSWTETYEFTAPLVRPGQFNIPTCYQSGTQTRYLNIASTQGLSRDRIERRKINFVQKSGRKLQRRYSLLVKQYGLSERAYNFWENVQEQQENSGSVFAPPPAPIPGNVYNVNDDTEPVLGYFQASSVTEKRVFVSRSEIPPGPGGSPGGFGECIDGDPEASDYCFDCSLMIGVTTETPSFW